MGRVLDSLRSWANLAKHKKIQDKNSNYDKEFSSFQNLPIELLEEIFQYLSEQDILHCRRVCSFLRLTVDQSFTRHLILVLNDGIYRRRPSQPIFFDFYKLIVQKMVIWKIQVSFIRYNFFSLRELDCSDCISTKNFQRLLENTPNLEILRMNSISMGGSKNLQPNSPKDPDLVEQTLTRPLSIREIHLTLDYVPGFYRGFSCQFLIANLLGVHNWNTPVLHTISFTVEPSCLMEQFYFSLDTFLSSIPSASYKSLTNLTINSPKLQPSSCTPLILNQDLLTIQLKSLSLQIPNSTNTSLSSVFTDFLYAQRNLSTLAINMKDGSGQEIEEFLKEQNSNL